MDQDEYWHVAAKSRPTRPSDRLGDELLGRGAYNRLSLDLETIFFHVQSCGKLMQSPLASWTKNTNSIICDGRKGQDSEGCLYAGVSREVPHLDVCPKRLLPDLHTSTKEACANDRQILGC